MGTIQTWLFDVWVLFSFYLNYSTLVLDVDSELIQAGTYWVQLSYLLTFCQPDVTASSGLESLQKKFNCRRHNEDGSYTYGYEGSDGSFKLETRFPDGRVQGRYGYVDIDTGKLKVIEYGADAMGFQVLDISSKQVTFLGNISLNKRELLGSKFTQFS